MPALWCLLCCSSGSTTLGMLTVTLGWLVWAPFDSLPLDHTQLLHSANCQLILLFATIPWGTNCFTAWSNQSWALFMEWFPRLVFEICFDLRKAPPNCHSSPFLSCRFPSLFGFPFSVPWSSVRTRRAPVFSVVPHPRQSLYPRSDGLVTKRKPLLLSHSGLELSFNKR